MIIGSTRARLAASPQMGCIEQDTERELVRRHYRKSSVVSNSHFGRIYRVCDPVTNEPVVVKMVSKLFRDAHINIFHGSATKVFEDTNREAQLLQMSRATPHPSVAAAAHPRMSLETSTHVGMALRSYNGDDLFNTLKAHGRLSPRAAVTLMVKLLTGVKHLHEVHGYTPVSYTHLTLPTNREV